MYDRLQSFSPTASQVMADSFNIAQENNSAYIHLEHFLYALMQVDLLKPIFSEWGIESTDINLRGSDGDNSEGKPTFSEQVEQLLQLAPAEAKRLHLYTVRSATLLSTMLKLDNTPLDEYPATAKLQRRIVKAALLEDTGRIFSDEILFQLTGKPIIVEMKHLTENQTLSVVIPLHDVAHIMEQALSRSSADPNQLLVRSQQYEHELSFYVREKRFNIDIT